MIFFAQEENKLVKKSSRIFTQRELRVHSHDETHKQQPWGPLSAKRPEIWGPKCGSGMCPEKKHTQNNPTRQQRKLVYLSRATTEKENVHESSKKHKYLE